MDNATENTAANRADFREGGTLDPNVTATAPFAPTHPDFPRGHGRWMRTNDVQGAGEP